MRLVIDTPNSNTGTLSGAVTVNGWALADDAAITSVSVSVDGRRFGDATYGGSRLDVCVVYPNRTGCPNVGWSYPLDTALLSDGTHRLEVTALSSSGKAGTVQSQFTVSNANANSAYHAVIEYPTAGRTLSGMQEISGWALNDKNFVSIGTISIDGIPEGPSTFVPISRPDVCTIYPGRPNCPYPGWRYLLNTLKFADGTHTLDVTFSTCCQQEATFSTTFTTSNYAPSNTMSLFVDQPAPTAGVLSGTAPVVGWALSNFNSFVNLSIAVDGVTVGYTMDSMPRPDVCAAYPGALNCPNVGWSYLLDTTALSDGPHTLTVNAGDVIKQSVNTKINVANGNVAPTSLKVYIDQPSASSPVLQGAIAVSGWAISTIGPLQPYVGIYIDDVPQSIGFVMGAQPRPDVCAIYPAAKNCPNVGWTTTFDTTLFLDGPHTLKAVSGSALFTVPITIGNSMVLNPMHLIIDSAVSGTLSGSAATLWGWAVSDDAAISTVAVSIDGAAVGNASYGDGRPDVCAIYQNRLGCPNVGWHSPVDSTKLSNGNHSISVTATSSQGEQITQTATVAVKN